MKIALTTTLFALLLAPTEAQLVTVTAIGTITSFQGTDSTVQMGTTFTDIWTINTATAGLVASGPYANMYNSGSSPIFPDPSFGETMAKFGGYTSTQVYSGANIFSGAPLYNQNAPMGSIYGYTLTSSPYQSSITNDLSLLSSTTPGVAPTLGLNSINQFPIADFDHAFYFYFADGHLNVTGNVTSYTVTTTPEPSIYVLVMLGVFALILKSMKCKFLAHLPRSFMISAC